MRLRLRSASGGARSSHGSRARSRVCGRSWETTMAELERDLRAVSVEWPPAPELAAHVRAQLAKPPPGIAWRRPLVVALAVLAVAIAAAFAVPSARTAILRWLGLQHVSVVRVERLPPTRRLATADLGEAMSLRKVRTIVP